MAGNSTECGRSVTSKITAILLTFTEGDEHTLTEIARLAGLPISTAHRLTSELTAWRLLSRTSDGRYRAGLPLRTIGGATGGLPTLAERAPCVLEDLGGATRRCVRLGVLRGLDVAYIEKQPGNQPVSTFSPAATLPAHPTAVGRALLAFSPSSTVEMVITRGLRPFTQHTITAPDRFLRALAVTRLTRVAVTRWELEASVSGVAVPVFGPGGQVLAAIEAIVCDLGKELAEVMAALTVAARSLSRELAIAPAAAGDDEPGPDDAPVVAVPLPRQPHTSAVTPVGVRSALRRWEAATDVRMAGAPPR